jgi:4-hydroxy-tetrahydrodipicolinate synthase
MKNFYGIIPPLVTPFKDNGKLDGDALRRVIRYVMDGGVHGVFIAGSTGEAYAMSDAERIEALEIAIDEVQGRVPVFAGTARITTDETVSLTKAAEAAGADAVSVVTPYFITPTQDELYDHYKAIAGAVKLPILLYNNPGRTGVNLNPDTIARLAKIDNIVGIKDSSGNMGNAVEMIRLCGKDFSFFCGFDMIIHPTLFAGGSGAVPASGNIAPRLIADLYESFIKGDRAGSLELQQKLAPLRQAFGLGTFPAVLKEGLNLMGVNVGRPKLPVRPLSDEAKKKLRSVLEGLGLQPVE